MKGGGEEGVSSMMDLSRKVIDVGELRVARTTKDKARGKARYVIYLPINRNYLWEYLYNNKVRIRVYFEIVEKG